MAAAAPAFSAPFRPQKRLAVTPIPGAPGSDDDDNDSDGGRPAPAGPAALSSFGLPGLKTRTDAYLARAVAASAIYGAAGAAVPSAPFGGGRRRGTDGSSRCSEPGDRRDRRAASGPRGAGTDIFRVGVLANDVNIRVPVMSVILSRLGVTTLCTSGDASSRCFWTRTLRLFGWWPVGRTWLWTLSSAMPTREMRPSTCSSLFLSIPGSYKTAAAEQRNTVTLAATAPSSASNTTSSGAGGAEQAATSVARDAAAREDQLPPDMPTTRKWEALPWLVKQQHATKDHLRVINDRFNS